MTHALFIGGVPHPVLELLADELAHREGVRAARFELATMLLRLREATRSRATIWQGVEAGPVEWIDPAVRRFAPDIVQLLGQGLPTLVLAHPDHGRHLELLEAALPDARFVIVASLPTEPGVPATEFIEPALRRAQRLGARLRIVLGEELSRDPDTVLASLVETFGLAGARRWQGPRPQPHLDPSPRVLDLLAVDSDSHRTWTALGQTLPDVDDVLERSPELGVRVARSRIADGDLEGAERALGAAGQIEQGSALFSALGLLRLRQRRESDAVHCLLRALHLDETNSEAWVALLSLPQRAETLAVAPFARRSKDAAVRRALARWLVARGLDAEAAEVVTATGL